MSSTDLPTLWARNTTTYTITGSLVTRGTWHHIVAVFTGDTDKALFVDGVADGTDANSVTYNSLVDRISVGRFGDSSPGNYINGAIAGGPLGPFYVDKALSLDGVKSLYDLGRALLGV